MKITCLTFAGKCGGFGASGLSAPSSAARPSDASSCEITAGIRIEPLNSERTIWRREQLEWVLSICFSIRLVNRTLMTRMRRIYAGQTSFSAFRLLLNSVVNFVEGLQYQISNLLMRQLVRLIFHIHISFSSGRKKSVTIRR